MILKDLTYSYRWGFFTIENYDSGRNEDEYKMRLDKYLKVSRIIKRRTVANEACDAGRVLVNEKPAKASVNVKVGDIIEVMFGTKTLKIEVLDVSETSKKEEAKEMYKEL